LLVWWYEIGWSYCSHPALGNNNVAVQSPGIMLDP
jgi:hypothetical protein